MDQITKLLTRGVDTIYPSRDELEKVLRSGKKLKLYQGFDPTGTQLHIGHMIGLRKLRQWQQLGHEVIFLIGTGTGLAGDPSGKLTARDKFLTEEELKNNAKDYVMQAKKLVNFEGNNPVKILYNGDWLTKLTLPEILEIAGHFSLQQLSERDLFRNRMEKGETVNLREFMYPLLQGYDSVAMDVDLEIGGSDQLFNMLVGRTLVNQIKQHEKFVMTTPLLEDGQGRKIGKTEGNVIALTDEPDNLFGKIMALPDEIIVKGLKYLTDVTMEEITEIEQKMQKGENPIQFKKRLTFEIVKQLNDENAAKQAEENFGKTVQHGELPSDISTITVANDTPLVDVVMQAGLVESKSELKRLIEQNGVRVNTEVISDIDLPVHDNDLIEIGKRRIVRIETN